MRDLIEISKEIIGNEEQQTVDARELWAFLGSKQEFTNWIKNRIAKYEFMEGVDYQFDKFINAFKIEEKHYTITVDMAKNLALVEHTKKGQEIRRYFIEVEKAFRAAQDKAKELHEQMESQQLKLLKQENRKLEAKCNKQTREINLLKAQRARQADAAAKFDLLMAGELDGCYDLADDFTNDFAVANL